VEPGINNGQDIVVDLQEVSGWVVSRWRLLLIVGVFGAMIGVGASFLVAQRFTATVTLMPKLPTQRSGLIGRLATLTNMDMNSEGTNEALYGRILLSDRILDLVLKQEWNPKLKENDLFDVLGLTVDINNDDLAVKEKAKRILRKQVITFNRDPASGFMKVNVRLPRSPDMAAKVANFLVSELDVYNQAIRTQKAREHRKFIELNFEQVSNDLAVCEDEMTQFLLDNITYRESPRLSQKYREIEREVEAQRSIWLLLRSQMESAKVDEHKDIASILILDRATAPLRRSYPNRIVFAIWGICLSFVLLLVWRSGHNIYCQHIRNEH
jgi:uncharacterized protein involved in exopolysaccharide biosynthesis